MKWILCVFSVVVILSSISNSATLQELDTQLRQRINKVDVFKSNFDTTTSFAWLNMAQDRIAVLAGFLPTSADFLYSGGLPEFKLPISLRALDGVVIKADERFYSIFYNPNFAIDTPVIQYTLDFFHEDTAKLLIKLGGFMGVRYVFVYSVTSESYILPENFRGPSTAFHFSSGRDTWSRIFPNPGLMIDTNIVSYTIDWLNRDTALFMISRDVQRLGALDSIAVFYERTLQSGDTVRVLFHSIAQDMPTGLTECQLPDDLEEFLVEEAMGYYFQYMGDNVRARSIWEQVRADLGFMRQEVQR